MSAFQLELLGPWTAGSILAGVDDALPLTALRVGKNVRLTRVMGAMTPRAGCIELTEALSATRLTGHWFSLLFGLTQAFGYAQMLDATTYEIFRFTDSFDTVGSLISGAGTARVFDANMLDGDNIPWKILTGPTLKKDNGTTLQTLGIPAPTSLPTVALGTRKRIPILSFDSGGGSWANTGVTSMGDESSIKVEGSNSLRVSVAADTLATVSRGFTGTSAFITGTDNLGVINKLTSLTDTTKDFGALGVTYGTRLRNMTDGSEAVVTHVSTTLSANDTLNFTNLSGGTDNDVDTGDTYELYFNLLHFDIVVTSGTDNSGTSNKVDRVVDTTKDFVNAGVIPGMLLHNPTNGARGTISLIATTTNPNDTLICHGGFGATLEADFDTGDAYQVINNLVAEDDYIHLQVRADKVDRVEYVQLDFDVDTATPASAFLSNYYTLRIPGAELTQGNDVWTELFLPKSRFTQIGTEEDWRNVRAVRLSFQTSTEGAVVFYVDDLSMIGGYGIEGDIEYTVFYRNSTTRGRGSPPKSIAFDDSELVLYTQKVEAKRHPIVITTSNVANPSDPQIDQLCLARRGGNLIGARLVARLPDSTTSYTDQKSDLELLNTEILEEDNDPPPADTITVFGPGGLNRWFYLAGQNRIYPSKVWEADESRAENVPRQGYFTLGDGSSRAMHGVVEGTTPYIWTTEGTYQIQGIGPDTFLPLRVEGSRGLAARDALTHGDGRIWFLAHDGIMEQQGIQQTKITSAIDPFFMGRTVHGVLPLDPARIGECSLRWHAHPLTPMVVLFYREATTGTMKRLVCQRNPQTNAYTDCFFDECASVEILNAYHDPSANAFYAVTDDSRVWQMEVEGATTDDGVAIPIRVQTVASTQERPRHEKQYETVVVDAQTNGESLTVTALYDRAEVSQSLGTFSTSSAVGQALLRTESVTRKRNIALNVEGSVSTLVQIHHLGWHTLLEPEAMTWIDTSVLSLDHVHYAKRLSLEIDAPADVTIILDRDGVAQPALTLLATAGRQRVPVYLPSSQKARAWRVTLSSATAFRLYQLSILVKPLGMPEAFSERPMYEAA